MNFSSRGFLLWSVSALVLFSSVKLEAATPIPYSASFFSSSLSTFDGGPLDYGITSISGAALAYGYAGTGLFSLSDDEVANLAASRNYAALFAAFRPIGGTDDFVSGGIENLEQPVPGVFFTTASIVMDWNDIGKTCYTLVSDNPDPSKATGFILMKSSESIYTPTPGPPVPENYAILPSNSIFLVGDQGSPLLIASLSNTPIHSIQLVAVPESSSLAMGAAGFMLLSRRRRR